MEGAHWLAVDRCFPDGERREALIYAAKRLVELEGRAVAVVEVEAAVVVCPLEHSFVIYMRWRDIG